MSHRRCRLSGDTATRLGFVRDVCKTVGQFIFWIFLSEGDYELAFESFEELLELEPDSMEATIGAATALNGLEEYSDSLEMIEKAIEIEPDNYQPWVIKGQAKDGLKQYESALAYYERVFELNPPQDALSVIWNYKSISLHELSRYQESIQAVNKALELNLHSSQVGDAIYLQARCYASLQDDGLALACLKTALELKPSLKIWIRKVPDWNRFDSDTRFQAIVGTQVTQKSVEQFFDRLRDHPKGEHAFIHNFPEKHEDVITDLCHTDLNQLPNNVQEAYNFYKQIVEDGDFGSVRAYKYSSAIAPIYVVGVSTDGDDGYLEIYNQAGESITYGRYDADVINWSNQETTRADLTMMQNAT
ncbi:MAG: tetratricopeptide repeat protein [Cyanobacteria bacterium J06633_8]